MPVGSGRRTARRFVTGFAIAVAIVLVALLLLGSGSAYRVHATLDNASQLIAGDQVKVGGVPVGSVDVITLDQQGRARLTLSIDDHSSGDANTLAEFKKRLDAAHVKLN